MNLQTAYLEKGLTHLSLKQTSNKIVRKLQAKGLHHRFDAIAFCGMSGAIFSPLVAAKLDKNLFVVRKENEWEN